MPGLSCRTAPGGLVAVPTERTAGTVCAILGILQAGCAYLPVDTTDTTGRTKQILAQAAPDLTLTSVDDLKLFDDVPSRPNPRTLRPATWPT